MQLPGTRAQQLRDFMFDASGSITAGGTSQLVLPERKSTSFLFFQNISDTDMYLEFGSARATATLTSGAVTSVTVTNGGFGFTRPPVVRFEGGGNTSWDMNNPSFLGCGQIGYPAPGSVARARCVLTAGVVSSIVVDSPGASYAQAPYVMISDSLLDPFGCADPFYGSAVSGFLIGSQGGSYYVNGTACTTDPISVYCASSNKKYTCRWMI